MKLVRLLLKSVLMMTTKAMASQVDVYYVCESAMCPLFGSELMIENLLRRIPKRRGGSQECRHIMERKYLVFSVEHTH